PRARAPPLTSHPPQRRSARRASEVIAHSGAFNEGFSLQTGTGGASLAVTRVLEDKMRSRNSVANFALGGLPATMVGLHDK
ncbi:citrate lyase subunit alpha, partial [Salmonella enterica subsp. enterica serovar Poona]